MWIAKNNDLIILAARTKKELQNSLGLMVYTSIESTEEDYVLYNGEYKTQAEIEAIREADFNKAFFNTSLGYIRRNVTLADGSHKDFLSDFVPTIQMAMSMGQTVNILTYSKPPFDEDITDWTPYQEIKAATPQFIMDCATQLGNDFLPINKNIGE